MQERIQDNIIFGLHPVEELIENRPHQIDRLYFDSAQAKGKVFSLLKSGRKKKIPCQCVPLQKLNQIAGSAKHQGAVALCPVKSYESIEQLRKKLDSKKGTPLLLIPASLEDPRNLGAIIRTSVAFEVSALLLERKQTTPLSSTVAKASVGMLEHMPVVKPSNLEKELISFKEQGFSLIGASHGNYKTPQEVDFTKPTILVLGGEHRGIPPYIDKLCDEFVTIPIAEPVPSLNVSVATAILLYECSKQRVEKV